MKYKVAGTFLFLLLFNTAIDAFSPDNGTLNTPSEAEDMEVPVTNRISEGSIFGMPAAIPGFTDPEQPLILEKWMTDSEDNNWSGNQDEPELLLEEWMYDLSGWGLK